MDERLVVQVRNLRQQGQSAKAIARTVGVSVADVVGVLNGAVLVADRGEPRCWVNAGWSRSVDLEAAPQWADLDPGAADAGEARGLIAVLVAADGARSAKAQVAGFLLDVWCLGVKNALPPEPMAESRLAEHRHAYFAAFGGHVQVPAEVARALVYGAAGYARGFGFDPEADFDAARAVLGEPAGPYPIGFGKDGKPCYVNGPYDDPEAIVRRLRAAVGEEGFHYALAFPEQPQRHQSRGLTRRATYRPSSSGAADSAGSPDSADSAVTDS